MVIGNLAFNVFLHSVSSYIPLCTPWSQMENYVITLSQQMPPTLVHRLAWAFRDQNTTFVSNSHFAVLKPLVWGTVPSWPLSYPQMITIDISSQFLCLLWFLYHCLRPYPHSDWLSHIWLPGFGTPHSPWFQAPAAVRGAGEKADLEKNVTSTGYKYQGSYNRSEAKWTNRRDLEQSWGHGVEFKEWWSPSQPAVENLHVLEPWKESGLSMEMLCFYPTLKGSGTLGCSSL